MIAAGPENPVVGEFFHWATTPTGIDWQLGAALAGAGVVGALITLYLLLGEPLPLLGNTVRITELRLRLSYLEKKRRAITETRLRLADQDPLPTERLGALEGISNTHSEEITCVQSELNQEVRRGLRWGVPLYVLLAGLIAAAFATNLIQALVVGFGWTTILDRLGVKQQESEREDRRAEYLGDITRDRDAQIAELRAKLASSEVHAASLADQLQADVGESPSNQMAANPGDEAERS